MTHLARAEARVFDSAVGTHLFLADGSRIYDLPPDYAAELRAGIARNEAAVLAPFADGARRISPQPEPPPPWRAVSLNIAQSCNMSCGYCYADEGRFGGHARMMSAQVARQSIDALISRTPRGQSVTIGFMGGEPLLNRGVLHDATRYAADRGAAAGLRVRFSLTTNATLITPADAALFAAEDFTITVSIDGAAAQNDAQRRLRGGGGSHAAILRGLAVMAEHGRPRQLGARITATAGLDLRGAIEHAFALGFDQAGFSGAFTAKDPMLRLQGDALATYRQEMLACGAHALAQWRAGQRYPFSNLLVALQELHRGTHRPYPCGAGAAYLSADAQGGLHACHRLVDAPGFDMGDVEHGPDDAKRAAHLARQHVDHAEPCRSCWARYLCGGGCYHEVAALGRNHCDAIRDWLAFCLSAYAEMSTLRPEIFA